MLYAIHKGNIASCPDGQCGVVHLVTSIEAITERAIPFVFTDGHAIMALTKFFDSLASLDRIDWAVMKSKYWNDTPAWPDRCRRRQAEFLAWQFVPLDVFFGIGVIDDKVREAVESAVRDAGSSLPVRTKAHFYF